MNTNLENLKQEIKPLQEQLINHALYSQIKSLPDLNIFMEHHVFPVWDFMSLLKSLQRQLTCIEIPWTPKGDAATRYLINEIVTGEESDVDQNGNRLSHFELYLNAMQQAGSNTAVINAFIKELAHNQDINITLQNCQLPPAVLDFVRDTFTIIAIDKPYIQAAVFTFGREDLIPGMFLSIIKRLNKETADKASIFQYYLERHIEIDGGHHAHLANQMTVKLCGKSEQHWQDATEAVKKALNSRIRLWDSILSKIKSTHS